MPRVPLLRCARRIIIPRTCSASKRVVPGSLSRPGKFHFVSSPLLGPLTAMSFGSSAQSQIDDQTCNNNFVVTCTVAQLRNHVGFGFRRWIVYRRSYDDDEAWEIHKNLIIHWASGAREGLRDKFSLTFVENRAVLNDTSRDDTSRDDTKLHKLKVIFVEDRAALNGTSRVDIRKLHNHLFSSIIPLTTTILAHQFEGV